MVHSLYSKYQANLGKALRSLSSTRARKMALFSLMLLSRILTHDLIFNLRKANSHSHKYIYYAGGSGHRSGYL